jgi:hypothetical protein
MGFTKSEANPNLYYILVGSNPFIMVLHIDDLFLAGVEGIIERCKVDLSSDFEMNIVLMHYFLGLQV